MAAAAARASSSRLGAANNFISGQAVGGKPSAGTIFRNIVRETGEQTQMA